MSDLRPRLPVSSLSYRGLHERMRVRREEAGLSRCVRTDRVAVGRAGEEVASAFLKGRGYEVLARNQRTPLGEIDLICRTATEMVVVEVKARSSDAFGTGLEAIGPRKARRLRGAALWWLCDRGMFPCQVRFDAVVVSLDERGRPLGLKHTVDIIGPGD